MHSSGQIQNTFPFGQKIAWEPNPQWINESNLHAFMKKEGIEGYDQLINRSGSDFAWFWQAVLKDLDIRFYTPYEKIVDLEKGIQFPKWCVGGRMNIIHNCLDKWQFF